MNRDASIDIGNTVAIVQILPFQHEYGLKNKNFFADSPLGYY